MKSPYTVTFVPTDAKEYYKRTGRWIIVMRCETLKQAYALASTVAYKPEYTLARVCTDRTGTEKCLKIYRR